MSTMTPELNDMKPRPFRFKWIIIAVIFLVLALAGGFFFARNYEMQKVEAGREAIAAENWEAAVAVLDDAINLQPSFLKQRSDEAVALRGFARYQLGDDEAALADFGASTSIDNRFFDLPAYRADILYRQGAYEEALGNAGAALAHEAALPPYLQAQLHGQKGLALLETESSFSTEVAAEIDAALDQAEYLPDELLSQLLTARALSAFADGDVAAGLADVAQVKALAVPVQGALLVAETAVLHQQADFAAALAAGDDALATDQLTDQETADLHLLRADIAYRQGDLAQAIAEAESATAYVAELALPDSLQAWQHYRQFEWDTAVDAADAALDIDPEQALAYRVRGAVAYWEGRYADAQSDLNRALELDPDDVEALALRSALHFSISDDVAARADAARAADLAPQSPAALWAQAAVHLQDYEPDEAYVLLTQAIGLDAQRPELYEWRGSTYLYRFQHDEQAADYDAALALYPEFGRAISSRLWMQLSRYEMDEYEETVLYLLDMFPDWDSAYRTAASYYHVQKGDSEQALVYAEEAVAINPTASQNYVVRGFVLSEQGETEKALADYEHALEISPDSVNVLAALAALAGEQGEQETALAYREEAFLLTAYPDQKITLANVYAQRGDMDRAWEMTHEVLAVDPDHEGALITRSLLRLDAGNPTQALNDLTVLISKYPGYAYAYVLRAQLRLDEGNLDEVRADANRALELDPFNMDGAHYLLGMAALIEEDLETAVTHIDNYVATGDENGFKYSVQAGLYSDQGRDAEAMVAIEAGLALEDDMLDQLLLDHATAYLVAQDDENARAGLEAVLADSVDLDILYQAENMLAYLNTLSELVNGRRVYADENYTLTYAAEWIQEPLTENLFNLLLIQEGIRGSAIVLVGAIEGVAGLTTRDFADAVESNLLDSPGFLTLSLEPAQISGRNGLVRYYELETVDADENPVVALGRQYYLVSGNMAVIISMETVAEEYELYSPELDAIIESFELLR